MSIELLLQNPCHYKHVPSRNQFKQWIAHGLAVVVYDHPLKLKILQAERTTLVGLRIVDRAESSYLKQHYLQKPGPTNILSFPYDELPHAETTAWTLGDLVFCADLIAQEASQQGKHVYDHWAHLTVHGWLHLLGYDHEQSHDAEIMEDLERRALATLQIEDPYS